jgi:hypothetical protein
MNDWVIFGIIFIGAIVLAILSYFFCGLFFYKLSVERKAIVGGVIERHLKTRFKKYKIDRKWWDHQEFEELHMDVGKEHLVGYLIRSKRKSSKVAIVVHGYSVTHRDVNAQAEIFLKNGYNVLAPDLRAHGKSSGKTIGMGAYDKGDVVLWIDKMIQILERTLKLYYLEYQWEEQRFV